MAPPITITPTSTVEVRVSDNPWPFAGANRAAIDAHFADLARANPALFNGAIWMLAEWSIEAGRFRGRAIRTDYASFLFWRDNDFPDPHIKNCFGAGALHGSDGRLILGVMGAHTANAGRIYPPSGSFEDADLVDGRIEVVDNIAREIAEETGITVSRPGEDGWLVIEDGPRIALIRRLDLGEPARAVALAIEAHIAADAEAELAGIHLVRGTRDIVPDRMPAYTQAYVRHAFAN